MGMSVTAAALLVDSGPLDLVLGLPAHPLIVHVAVVILPLAALSLMAIVFVPAWRRSFGWIVMAALVVGVGGSFLAKESGEALAARVGWPAQHAQLGDLLPLVAFSLLAAGFAWFILAGRDRRAGRERTSVLTRLIGAAATVLATAAIILTIAVGHSGAVAVWEPRLQPVAQSPSSAPGDAGLTMEEVAAHATPDDCWSVVDGRVYDLTSWIEQHPGGAGPIESMCGVDATEAFMSMHGSQQAPNDVLAGYEIGLLAT